MLTELPAHNSNRLMEFILKEAAPAYSEQRLLSFLPRTRVHVNIARVLSAGCLDTVLKRPLDGQYYCALIHTAH
jgi:hypothetical protein